MMKKSNFALKLSDFVIVKHKKILNKMEIQELEKMIREKESSLSLAFPALMRKVYVWMTLALIITAVTAYGVAHSPALLNLIYYNNITLL